MVATDEGFELTFELSELVKIDNHTSIRVNFAQLDADNQAKNISTNKRKIPRKEKKIPPMEVDLHIHQLVNSTKNMSNHDILTLQLDTARHKLEFAIAQRIQRVVFIHGVGEGVLRTELEFLLGRYPNVKYYDAQYTKYGLGATEAHIFQKDIKNHSDLL